MTLSERLARYLEVPPRIHPTAFIAEGARVIGDVDLSENVSVWYNAVLRGDIQSITVGPGSNIQDNCTVHLDNDHGTQIGEYVTVGHGAIIHACNIGNEVLVGMGATILDGAVIGDRCIIGAHALVTLGMEIPSGSMVMGTPAKIVRTLSAEAQTGIRSWAEKYVAISRRYIELGMGVPHVRFGSVMSAR
jgi:carbonic anhydrase/acetyltransferase-like protein (isoleucine patch superfamily)